MLVIKRIKKPGQPHYYVTCGGGQEPDDATLIDTLKREAMEELGARLRVLRRVLVVTTRLSKNSRVREHFYLCRLVGMNLDRRTGAEVFDPRRGKYLPHALSLKRRYLARVDLRPPALHDFLLEHTDTLTRAPEV